MGRTVGEQQKNSTVKPDLLDGRLADNRKISIYLGNRGCPFGQPFLNSKLTVRIYIMKYDKKKALGIIINAAKKYDEYLKSQNFIIIYKKENLQSYVEVGFRDLNFLHLTGVQTKISAQRFYDLCIDGKLSEKDFEIDNAGKVQQKLIVLPYLHELLYHNCMIGDFINSGIMIRADYFVGDTKAVLSVGFRNGKNIDMPVTLFNEDVRKLIKPSCKVIAIFRKAYDEEKYMECTYHAKDIDLAKVSFPENVKTDLLVSGSDET